MPVGMWITLCIIHIPTGTTIININLFSKNLNLQLKINIGELMLFSENKNPNQIKAEPLDMEKWRVIIAEWEVSQESQKNYCARLGININTFAYARSKLSQNKKSKPTFIPIALKQTTDQTYQKDDIIIIENPEGFKLHVSSALSLDRLAKIFKLCGW